jgi:quercetin dioxygenase-like cupin family protein
MTNRPIVRALDSVVAHEVERSTGATIQTLLGPADGVPNYFSRRFTIQPDGVIPTHRHHQIEHEQVVLKGEMVLILDGEEHRVHAGDCIYIPPRVAHRYENRGTSAVEFICVVPACADYQTEWLED